MFFVVSKVSKEAEDLLRKLCTENGVRFILGKISRSRYKGILLLLAE